MVLVSGFAREMNPVDLSETKGQILQKHVKLLWLIEEGLGDGNTNQTELKELDVNWAVLIFHLLVDIKQWCTVDA